MHDSYEFAGINDLQLSTYHSKLITEVQIELKLLDREFAMPFDWTEEDEKLEEVETA